MEYLSPDEIGEKVAEITEELHLLLRDRLLVGKPNALQWRFFVACFHRLLAPTEISEFDGVDHIRAAQWKFEVEDKLRRFYLRPGREVKFVFSMVHRSKLAEHGFDDETPLPDLSGYCVLVRDLSVAGAASMSSPATLRAYLERVVVEATDAEFKAYMALPEMKTDELERWFIKDGPAYKEVVSVLMRNRQKHWTLSNPHNPSTKRILTVGIKSVGAEEALARTTEYWYLYWWSSSEQRVVYPYRETNRQLYVLRREAGEWKVYQNLFPPPRTSVPNRKVKGRGRVVAGG